MPLQIVLLGDINLVPSPGVWKYQINVFFCCFVMLVSSKEPACLKKLERISFTHYTILFDLCTGGHVY